MASVQIEFWVKRYGYPERRVVEVDVEELVAEEFESTVFSIAGFDDDWKDTIDVERVELC
jgi:hypothetical protein